MRIVDLEDLARKTKWMEKHADKLIISDDGRRVIVVEETSRPKTDDVRKLDNTVNAIKRGLLKNILGSNPSKIIAVIHALKRLDTMINKMLICRSKRNTIYCKASCSRELNIIMRKHKIY